MPGVPQLKSCCFCLSTEVGTKCIGWVCTIFGALQAIGYLIDLLRVLPRLGKEYSGGDVFEIAVMVAVAVIFTLLGIYLLLGVYKGNQAYVKLWVNAAVVLIIILLIVLVLRLFSWVTGRGRSDIVVNIVDFLLICYFTLVVNSYLREQGSGIEAF